MCGISGAIWFKGHDVMQHNHGFIPWFIEQQQHISQRGIDALGVTYIDLINNEFTKNIDVSHSLSLIRDAVEDMNSQTAIMINYRNIPTTEYFGRGLDDDQIQPFITDNSVVTHNGLLANDQQLAQTNGWPRFCNNGEHDVDSYAFLHLMQNEKWPFNLRELQGSWAIATWQKEQGFVFSRTFLGLDLCVVQFGDNQYFVWGSELKSAVNMLGSPTSCEIKALPSYSTLQVNVDNIAFTMQNPVSILRSIMSPTLPIWPLPIDNSVAVVASGGLDSTVVATLACQQYQHVHLLHFQYGALAEAKEVRAMQEITQYLQNKFPDRKISLQFIDLSYLKQLGGSRLTDSNAKITEGELGVELAVEWVPARNLVMLALAAAYCDRHDIHAIALGLNREESAVYSDNSTEFFQPFEIACDLGTKSRPKMWMPLANKMKSHIVKLGMQIRAPMHLSWSCYRGHAMRCGTCGPDIMRQRAFAMNGLIDSVNYAKPDLKAESILKAVTNG